MKKTLSLLLVLVMVLSMIPLTVFAEDTTLAEGYPGALEAGEGETVTFEASAAGKATFTIYASTGVLLTDADGKEVASSADASGTHVLSVDIAEGANTFSIFGWDGSADCATSIVMYTVVVAGDESSDTNSGVTGDGSLMNPYVYTSVDALVADWNNRTVGAGAVIYVQAPLGGETLTVTSDTTAACLQSTRGANLAFDNEAFTFGEDLGVAAGENIVIGIYNQNPRGDAVVTLSAGSAPAATTTLVDGPNAVELAAGDWDGETWTYTATAAGELTVEVTALSYYDEYEGVDIDMSASLAMAFGRGAYTLTVNGESNWTNTQTITVAAGQTVTVQLASSMGNKSAATINLSMTEGSGEVAPVELKLDNNSIEAADVTYTYTATEAGTLTLTTKAAVMGPVSFAYTINDGEEQAMELSSTYDLKLAAGDVVNVIVVAEGYSTLTASWTAGSGAGEGDGTQEAPYVIKELPYEIVVDGEHDIYYVWTPEADGTLTISYPAGNYVSGLPNYEVDYEEAVYTSKVTAGEAVSINPWGNYAGTYVLTFEAGSNEPEVPAGPETVDYVNKATPAAYSPSAAGDLDPTYVNVEQSHTAVLGEDGYYHLDAADGDIIVVNMTSENAYGVEIPGMIAEARLKVPTYGEDGSIVSYENYANAMLQYMEAANNEGTAWVYLTEDLISFFQGYGAAQGWYNANLSTYLAEVDFDADTAWMLDCATVTGVNVQMYRLYNPNSGEHFYTGSVQERDNLVAAGWNYEGPAWVAPRVTGMPIYRLYNPNAGDHHYTGSEEERDNLVAAGWNYEGVAWNTPVYGVPVYRLYNPNAECGAHHFTTSEGERDYLVSVGWVYEDIAWNGVK